jgi:ABC-type transport system substrate-binding protein
MFRLRVKFLLLTILVLVTVLSAAPASSQGDNILRILSNADIRTSDPHIAYETETWPTASLFYVGLVKQDIQGNPVPGLAESWTISDDGLVYTFTLREGLKFSNGRDLTTEDVKYSFERILDPATGAPTSFFFAVFEGAEAKLNGEADEVSGIRIIDERTIEFTLTRPEWTMMKRFALPPGFIVAREGVEEAENFGFEPLGAGPFVLESWEPGVRIVGSRNPNYYEEGKPYVDGFEMSLGIEPSVGILRIEAGEADVALDFVPSADYPRLAGDPALAERLIPLAAFPNIDYVIFNHNLVDEPFSDVRVRRALSMAIDRERLVQLTNGRSVPAAGPIPPSVLGDNPELQPQAYDPEGARALLAEAGYPDGFSTEFLSNTDPQAVAFSQAIIADWANVGVQATLTSIDNAQFLDLLINQPEPDSFHIAFTEWYLDYLDPSNVYEPLHQCGGSYNWGHICNEELDAFFEEANAIPPGDDRWAAFAELEARLVEAQPSIYLQHRQNYYFTSERLTIEGNPAVLLVFADATVQ